MTRTALACPEPGRHRNEPIAWTTGTTTGPADGTGGGNVRIEWLRVDTQR